MKSYLAAAALALFTAFPATAVPVQWVVEGDIQDGIASPGNGFVPGSGTLSILFSFVYDAETNEISDVMEGLAVFGLNMTPPFSPPLLIGDALSFSLINGTVFSDGTIFYDVNFAVTTLAPLTDQGGSVGATLSLIAVARSDFDSSRCTTLDQTTDLFQFFCIANPVSSLEAAILGQGQVTLTGTPIPPSTVPLPAGLPLLLAALGGLAFCRRRTAA